MKAKKTRGVFLASATVPRRKAKKTRGVFLHSAPVPRCLGAEIARATIGGHTTSARPIHSSTRCHVLDHRISRLSAGDASSRSNTTTLPRWLPVFRTRTTVESGFRATIDLARHRKRLASLPALRSITSLSACSTSNHQSLRSVRYLFPLTSGTDVSDDARAGIGTTSRCAGLRLTILPLKAPSPPETKQASARPKPLRWLAWCKLKPTTGSRERMKAPANEITLVRRGNVYYLKPSSRASLTSCGGLLRLQQRS